jgi:uncharacterized protein YdiU (UPF0061 family)
MNQPRVARWNLARFAETLLPLLAEEEPEAVRIATGLLEGFPALFSAKLAAVLRQKLGLEREEEEDTALAEDLLERLAASSVDYTVFFRRLCAAAANPERDAEVAALFSEPEAFHLWALAWRRRCERDGRSPEERARAMRGVNPAFIPRNHRIEQAIEAAVRGDFSPFERLVAVLARPFDEQPEHADLAAPPAPEERVQATFCGT